jgi:hypothetical protein
MKFLYKTKLTKKDYLSFRYMVKFQLDGSLWVVIGWFQHDMPLHPAKTAVMAIIPPLR